MAGVTAPGLVLGVSRTPLPFGLFSTFTFRPLGERWQAGVKWESDTCDTVDGLGQWQCPTSEVQTVTEGGSGLTSFTLTYDDQTTASIPAASTAAAVQTALENLSNIAVGDVTVTGDTSGPYTVTFRAELGNVVEMTATPTGGTGTVTVDTVTEGAYTTGFPKDLTKSDCDTGEAIPFTVYATHVSSPVGFNPEAAQARAVSLLYAREEARVEQALWTGDLSNAPVLASATADLLNSGTAIATPLAVGLMEEYIATTYGSQGVIHLDRFTASDAIAHNMVVANGPRLTTVLGTPIVAGAGYPGTGPNGEAATVTQRWAYASPALFGYRTEVFDSSARPGDLLDRTVNDLFAVAERTYLVGFDPCGVGAVLIDTTL